jgi:hypothetical protein
MNFKLKKQTYQLTIDEILTDMYNNDQNICKINSDFGIVTLVISAKWAEYAEGQIKLIGFPEEI